MKKNINIRHATFETNSSSSHSICIAANGELKDTLFVDDLGVVSVGTGEFGWEVEAYFDAQTKAEYCHTWARQSNNEQVLLMLEEVIKEHTGAHTVVLEKEEVGDWGYPYGYIDHQSSDVCLEAFNSKETLKQFIFNTNSALYTDNDNY